MVLFSVPAMTVMVAVSVPVVVPMVVNVIGMMLTGAGTSLV